MEHQGYHDQEMFMHAERKLAQEEELEALTLMTQWVASEQEAMRNAEAMKGKGSAALAARKETKKDKERSHSPQRKRRG